jgi:hypothetical protein
MNRLSYYIGDAAWDELMACINCMGQDDANGTVGVLMGGEITILDATDPMTVEALRGAPYFALIVIDGGNTHGDAWKYVYHPGAKYGVFINESEDSDNLA